MKELKESGDKEGMQEQKKKIKQLKEELDDQRKKAEANEAMKGIKESGRQKQLEQLCDEFAGKGDVSKEDIAIEMNQHKGKDKDSLKKDIAEMIHNIA